MAINDPELGGSGAADTGSGGDDWFNQVTPNSPGPAVNPYPGAGGTPTDPHYGNTPDDADPWGRHAGDPDFGYPPSTQTATPTPTPSTPSGPYGPLNQVYGGSMPSVSQYTPPPFSYADFAAPDPFSAPSAQSVLDNDPGYQFRLDQGTQALQQSAAARGTLNTGGTLQDLVNYGQNYASSEYGNAYNRALGTYQTNFSDALNAYQTNFGGALAGYNSRYQTQYLNPYNQLIGQYNTNNSNYQNAQDRAFGQQFATATA